MTMGADSMRGGAITSGCGLIGLRSGWLLPGKGKVRKVSTIGLERMSEGSNAETKQDKKKEQNMQRRRQHRGGGARHRLAAALRCTLGSRSGTQKRVRQDILARQNPKS